jgi:3-hydroxymyristoyl/3-hydroxydecanoyl-(acyl carrier protein) dehydratase
MTAGALLPFLEAVTLEESPAGIRIRGLLTRDHPIYAGHFPGRPILPAIAQLELVRAAASHAAGRHLALTRIAFLKLRQILAPGMEIELEITAAGAGGAAGEHRFAISARGSGVSGGSPVSSGTVVLATAPPPAPPAPPIPARGSSGALERLLPHSPPARFLAACDETFADRIACTAVIPGEHALTREGCAPSFVVLEAGAQAAGLLEALALRGGEGTPSVGFIVGLREVFLDPAPIAAGRPFRVEAQRSGGAGPLAIYEVEAVAEGRLVLRGSLSAYLPAAPGGDPDGK